MKKALMIAAAAAFAMGAMAASADASALGKCKACHNFDTSKKVGPGLKGIAGGPVGASEGFKYGDYLAAQNAAGATWTDEALEAWICGSKDVAKAAGSKTKMPNQKVCGDKAKAAVAELKAL